MQTNNNMVKDKISFVYKSRKTLNTIKDKNSGGERNTKSTYIFKPLYLHNG